MVDFFLETKRSLFLELTDAGNTYLACEGAGPLGGGADDLVAVETGGLAGLFEV